MRSRCFQHQANSAWITDLPSALSVSLGMLFPAISSFTMLLFFCKASSRDLPPSRPMLFHLRSVGTSSDGHAQHWLLSSTKNLKCVLCCPCAAATSHTQQVLFLYRIHRQMCILAIYDMYLLINIQLLSLSLAAVNVLCLYMVLLLHTSTPVNNKHTISCF